MIVREIHVIKGGVGSNITNNMQQDTEEDGSLLEIIELAHSLRQEQLFITNEQNSYISLNESLVQNASRVAQVC